MLTVYGKKYSFLRPDHVKCRELFTCIISEVRRHTAHAESNFLIYCWIQVMSQVSGAMAVFHCCQPVEAN